MEITSYRVQYKDKVGHHVTHLVHCLDDALKLKNDAKKEKCKDITFDKLVRNFDYSITYIPLTV